MANFPKMTLADQALANAIFCIAGMPVVHDENDRTEYFACLIGGLLFEINRDHPHVDKLAKAGEKIRDLLASGRPRWASEAYYVARMATREFAEWRLLQVMDLLQDVERAA